MVKRSFLIPAPVPWTCRVGPPWILMVVALLGLGATNVEAQGRAEAQAGPLIHSGGAVFHIPNPDFPTPLDHRYRVVFDVAAGSERDGQVATGFNSVARFMNMHAQAGVPAENLDLVVVVHGTAAKDLLVDSAYRERLGYENPNATLLAELMDAGVRVVLCGQSAMGRVVPREGLMDGVEVALSAMTAHQVLQAQGYRENPF